jgi:hypothetical protein
MMTPMSPPLARSSVEAHMYMDLHPCECGAREFARDNDVTRSSDGTWRSEYTGACENCGRHRSFAFRVADEVPIIEPASWSGLEHPSELLDPGEWLWVADLYGADRQPGDAPGTVPARLDELGFAASAIDEVLLFLPSGADVVPVSALRTGLGRQMFAADPDRFHRTELEALRDRYRQRSGEQRGPGPAEPVAARSLREANAFSALRFCTCGENRFERRVVDEIPRRGRTLIHVEGPCAGCGRRREFLFDVPDGLNRPLLGYSYGYPDDGPSTIIDAGQWYSIAAANSFAAGELASAAAVLDAEDGVEQPWRVTDEWEEMAELLTSAVAAWDEVLRFIPEHASRVPPQAFWTATGRNIYRTDPGAFARERLVGERAGAVHRLDAFTAAHPGPGD